VTGFSHFYDASSKLSLALTVSRFGAKGPWTKISGVAMAVVRDGNAETASKQKIRLLLGRVKRCQESRRRTPCSRP
jgi:hypothetical protein